MVRVSGWPTDLASRPDLNRIEPPNFNQATAPALGTAPPAAPPEADTGPAGAQKECMDVEDE
jgi:hypothetical protein